MNYVAVSSRQSVCDGSRWCRSVCVPIKCASRRMSVYLEPGQSRVRSECQWNRPKECVDDNRVSPDVYLNGVEMHSCCGALMPDF